MNDFEKILRNLVRLGSVTAIDIPKRLARVKFHDTGITSGWLPVLDNRPFIPDYEQLGVSQRTEFEAGGSGDPAFASHKHDLIIKPWMPFVGDQVLALYLPVQDADGFILGRVHTWQ